jgi:hypothetical protein
MNWLIGGLVLAVGVIGVETWLLLEKPIPPPPLREVVIVPPDPPAPTPLRPVIRRNTKRTSPAAKPETKQTQRPFTKPKGGIFSGADPRDPRIYHFSGE